MAGGVYYDEKRRGGNNANPFVHVVEQATSKQNRKTLLIVGGIITTLLLWSTFGGISQPKVGHMLVQECVPHNQKLNPHSSTNDRHSSFRKTIMATRLLYLTSPSNHQNRSTTD